MFIEIVGQFDKNQIYCAGSFTKFLTTYISLSLLAEQSALDDVLDDDSFLDSMCMNAKAKEFLFLFQEMLGGQFSIRDLCSYYSGLPYTFDLSEEELKKVDVGYPFKHHSIRDEETFLYMCRHKITPVYKARCKFHYSEIGILFLGYFLEKNYSVTIEDLCRKYVTDKFQLTSSQFSRKRVAGVYCQDLSDKYDYPAIAILDHGYFAYSNGYYTTLNDMKVLLECLLVEPVFQHMVDIKKARAASPRLMNGLAVELRLVNDDVIYGYEGLSFSGCNIWAYSTKEKKGYLTFSNNEEAVYDILYKDQWGYENFDKVPDYTQDLYATFIKGYQFSTTTKEIPSEYQGSYHRVKINEKNLATIFLVGNNFIVIRNPEEIKYDIIYFNGHYCVKGKDGVHGARVGFYAAESGNKYMLYDGTLYRKIES